MSTDDKRLRKVARCLRKKMKLGTITYEEAQQLYDEAEPLSLSKNGAEEILKMIAADKPLPPSGRVEPSRAAKPLDKEVHLQATHLFRLPGESDPEAVLEEERIRQEMLKQEEINDKS
jgi:hypothetical protein